MEDPTGKSYGDIEEEDEVGGGNGMDARPPGKTPDSEISSSLTPCPCAAAARARATARVEYEGEEGEASDGGAFALRFSAPVERLKDARRAGPLRASDAPRESSALLVFMLLPLLKGFGCGCTGDWEGSGRESAGLDGVVLISVRLPQPLLCSGW